ncbi:hypothetical protein HIM_02914 [Hirsutella minnesotensis 3608]|nr:hypothetical protein HIM_02914 [Hirsutella minnesotensis 3608]
MATLKVNYGLPASPADGLRSRRKQETASRTQRSNYNLASQEAETAGTYTTGYPSHSQPSDRIPRSVLAQRTSLPRPSSRLPSNNTSTKAVSRPARNLSNTLNHSRSPSCSSSSLSQDAGRKPSSLSSSKKKPPVSHNAASIRKVGATASSSLSRFDSRLPREPLGKTCRANQEPLGTPGGPEERRKPDASPVIMYPELDRYRNLSHPDYTTKRQELEVPHRLATHDLPPPTPASLLFSGSSSQISTISGSPSTRLSESPGPGPYSRDTTPTSTCSQSPVLIIPSRLKVPSRGQQGNSTFVRQPGARRGLGNISQVTEIPPIGMQDLTPIRESVTSSSSSSTVRDGDKNLRDTRPSRKPSPMIPESLTRRSSQKAERDQHLKHVPLDAVPESRLPREKTRSPIKTEGPTQPETALAAKTITPARPSREGTPDMQLHFLEPAPVIRSNISLQTRPMDKRNIETAATTSSNASILSLSQSRRNASTPQLPAMRRTISRTESPQPPSQPRRANSHDSPRSEELPTKMMSSFSTKFPFFGRKKNITENSTDNKGDRSPPKKLTRKGPVAGTGHEGYGRFAAIRRRSSSGSNLSRRLVEPQEQSLAGGDSFLADRVRPVVIAGGEVVENKNTVAETGLLDVERSNHHRRPSTPLRDHLKGTAVNENARNTLWPSPVISNSHELANASRLHENGVSTSAAQKPTLAFRRSLQRLRLSVDNPIRLPQPINTNLQISASPMTSIDTTVTTEDSHKLRKESSHGSNDTSRKLPSATRLTRKWTFFGRSHSRQNASASSEEAPALVQAVAPKPVAFYTMMDSEQEDSPRITEADKLPAVDPEPALSLCEQSDGPEILKPVSSQPQILTTPGENPPKPSPVESNRPAPTLPGPPGKRSRLQHVGRIPQVISRRVQNTPPPTFSRPFQSSPYSSPQKRLSVYDPESIATGPSPPNTSRPFDNPLPEESSADSGNNTSSRDSVSKLSSEVTRGEREFLAFPRRNHSVATIDTHSSGSREICIVADATAVIPKPHDPLHEDEIWDEYNDLLDDDSAKMFLSAMPPPTAPSQAKPRRNRSIRGDSIMSIYRPSMSRNASAPSRAPSHSASTSADMTERLRKAFQQKQDLGTTADVTAPSAGLGVQQVQVPLGSGIVSAAKRQSTASGKTVFTDCSTISSDEESPLAQVNLRVGSMTVSKWLSFGHVLFSDIRHELDLSNTKTEKQSILVIDGLGNDDWSFYAAETYPRASFYNMSPRAALPPEMRSSPSSFPLSPANHHQVQYISHLDRFPFAPQSFNCLVYRFPVAAPESHYRNIINEARRVLRPGGYIELSVLDVDLNNMGNRGRRTVRQLKERIHQESPCINLSSTADLILRLMNSAGFSGIKAARVGVPVASSITRSGVHQLGRKDKPKLKETSSLADMIKDHSPTADEGINKLVTRVGRWWYTQCYENAISPATDKSIWSSKTLLSECEERGTSLKLMVCCARAPSRIPSV